MITYRIDQEGLKKLKQKLFWRCLTGLSFVFIAGLLFSMFGPKELSQARASLLPIAIIIPLLLGIRIHRELKKKGLDSYTLTFYENMMVRQQEGLPEAAIYFNEISKITRSSDGRFKIIGKDPTDIIYIPAVVEHYNEVEKRLLSFQPAITHSEADIKGKLQFLQLPLIAGSMIGVFYVNNKIVVALSGCVLLYILISNLLKAKNDPNTDPQTRAMAKWSVFVIVCVLFGMIAKLIGMGVLKK